MSENLSRLTLPERARKKRGAVFVVIPIGSLQIAPDLKWLGNASDVVLLGSVLNGQSMLTDSQRSIISFYTVKVRQAFKGNAVAPDAEITLYWPGGYVAFGRGLSAQVRVPGLDPPVIGEQYVLFLSRLDEGEPLTTYTKSGAVYRLALGSQSVFHVRHNGFIRVHAPRMHPVARHEGEGNAHFVDRLNELAFDWAK